MKNQYNVIVIGGGPAGLIASATAAKRGKSVLLIEKNKVLAKKLRITGKGRCNITNSADVSDFLANVNVNASFLYSAFYSFTGDDIIALLESLGVKTKTERGGRVFPASDKASDVADALITYATECGAKILNAAVKEVLYSGGCACGVVTSEGARIAADSVVIATGGISYPQTGSTGDGYTFAKAAGHTVTDLRPSLVPLTTAEKWVPELMGLSLKNVAIRVTDGERLIYSDFGEMLFTHFGVSGPVILSASAHIKDFKKTYALTVDLKPALTPEQLDKRILRDFETFANKNFSNALGALLPQKLISVVVALSGIPPTEKVHQITKAARQRLTHLLKNLRLTVNGSRSVAEAVITSGGVSVAQINPSTMASKLADGLYFAGEVIDVDAYTGGYNLQIAYSTGFLAGSNA